MGAGTAGPDERNLVELNEKFGEAELARDESFFRDVLADHLIFRRASGAWVSKDGFLEDLVKLENTYEYIVSRGVEVIFSGTDTALVSLLVWAKGRRGDNTFHGIFRNTRLFVKQGEAWRCAVWFNSREAV